ncbi:MAG TPA: hypothetical protein VMH81_34485 [Bryobacteraceae bacterium]|nr:hypothetical protein [Bryobacteraceae bacterium]
MADKVKSPFGKLMAAACVNALLAFVFGLCLGRVLIQRLTGSYVGLALSGASLILAFLWTSRAVRRIGGAPYPSGDAVRKNRVQFLWSCTFFAMISFALGIAVSSFFWYGPDFIQIFGLVFWCLITCVAIYPVRRDAKRFAGTT